MVDLSQASVIEYVTFKINDGITQANFIKAANESEMALKTITGFIHRSIALQENGTWIEVVFWENKQVAIDGLNIFLEHEQSKNFLNFIDNESIKIEYSQLQ